MGDAFHWEKEQRTDTGLKGKLLCVQISDLTKLSSKQVNQQTHSSRAGDPNWGTREHVAFQALK